MRVVSTYLFLFLGLTLTMAPGEEFSWETVGGVEQLRIDTELLSGVFVARDERELGRGFALHGFRGLVFKPTGKDLHASVGKVGAKRRHQGHLNVYRVYAGKETFGSLRDDLAEVERLDDGAQLTWPASEQRPVEVSATWRITGAAQIDLEIEAIPNRDLSNFEILPAVYCPVQMVKRVYLERNGEAEPVVVKTPDDSEESLLYPFFPLTAEDREPQKASGRIQSEWTWPTSVEEEEAALPIVLADDGETEIILFGHPDSTSAVCATPRPDSGEPENWNSVGQHSALYLSFFCRDIKAGEKQLARARLIYRTKTSDSAQEHRQLYQAFTEGR
ncbi:MAG: hypothetical protein AAGH89_04420 [Verrucomicrobiota bacterium]